ncbi:TPA: hypothetical protein ACXEZB_004374 [Escherichia coli]
MDINQKFIDDVIITMMELNDRIVALEEMAAEHAAYHDDADEAAELTRRIQEQNRIFAMKATDAEMKENFSDWHSKPAPEVEILTADPKREHELVEQANQVISAHMKKWGMIGFRTEKDGIKISAEIA